MRHDDVFSTKCNIILIDFAKRSSVLFYYDLLHVSLGSHLILIDQS